MSLLQECEVKGRVQALSFSPDGRLLSAGTSWPNSLVLWNLTEPTPRTLCRSWIPFSLNAASAIVWVGFPFSDGATLLASHYGWILRYWNAQTGKKVGEFQFHEGDPTGFWIGANGPIIVKVLVWLHFPEHAPVDDVCYPKAIGLVIYERVADDPYCWKLRHYNENKRFHGKEEPSGWHKAAIDAVGVGPGNRIASVSLAERVIKIWNAGTGEVEGTLGLEWETHHGRHPSISPTFSHDLRTLAAVAGTACNFTVTAKYADGSIDTHYIGSIHFTSSDPQAVLPPDYTFTAADAGVHTFSTTLKTAGTQSITATDYNVTGTDGNIMVTPAAASTLSVFGFPSPITAGVVGSFTITARDSYGNMATSYTGTVHFTSSDAKSSLPANYTFTGADAGIHTFSATLKTAGTQSITVKDTATGNLTATDGGITVIPAAASQFIISAPASVTAGVPFNLTVKVEDAYGNVVTNYTGTIHFSSTDRMATLPKNYTFTAADKGVHTFTGLVLRTRGFQKITITDTRNSFLFASDIIDAL
jgi:WD40 repeat protein